MFWIAFALIVAANVVYHLAQKSTPAAVHPVATMIGLRRFGSCSAGIASLVAVGCPGRALAIV